MATVFLRLLAHDDKPAGQIRCQQGRKGVRNRYRANWWKKTVFGS